MQLFFENVVKRVSILRKIRYNTVMCRLRTADGRIVCGEAVRDRREGIFYYV